MKTKLKYAKPRVRVSITFRALRLPGEIAR